MHTNEASKAFDDFWDHEHYEDIGPRLFKSVRATHIVLAAIAFLVAMAVWPVASPGPRPAAAGQLASASVAQATQAADTTSGCTADPVFDDQLRPPWYPASWSGTTVDLRDGQYDVTLPLAWSAFSVASPPVSVNGCQYVQFDISSPTANPRLDVVISNGAGQQAGRLSLQNSPLVDGGQIDSTIRTATIPFDQLPAHDGSITRFTLVNTGEPGTQLTVDNIRFGPTGTTSTTQPPTQSSTCHQVYDDSLNPSWQPASWTVENQTLGQEVSVRFPQRWGALSFLVTDQAVLVDGCNSLSFTIQSSVDANFDIRLNTANNDKAGDVRIAASTSATEITIPLTAYNLVSGQVTRLSIINRADAPGTEIIVDNIRFTGGIPPTTQPPTTQPPTTQAPTTQPPTTSEPTTTTTESTSTTAPPQPQTIASGVNVPSAEYECTKTLAGDGYEAQIFEHLAAGVSHQEMAQHLQNFGAKTVRIPMNSHCWLGGFGYLDDRLQGENYRREIVAFVDALRAQGITSWLELHWSAPQGQQAKGQTLLPDADYTASFWVSVADRFKGYGDAVFYGPFNEPHIEQALGYTPAAWACWRDGCSTGGQQYVGMQQMVDAIRSTGSTQYIALGGLNYAYIFDRWLEYVPNDPANKLVADSHVYNFKACNGVNCFSDDLLAIKAAGHQVVLGELGQGANRNNNTCEADFVNTIMDWADNNNISYVGWAYNATQGTKVCGPNTGYAIGMVNSWDGSATTPMGEAIRQRLIRQ